jgi:hypothetical protein
MTLVRNERTCWRALWHICLAALAVIAILSAESAADRPALPRLYTHQSYVEDVTQGSTLQIDDPKAVFAYVLNALPDRVKVYPTENYYYFYFYAGKLRYAGNIRLDAVTRDQGKVHIAYSIDLAEWKEEDPVYHKLLDATDGVTVERAGRLTYRVTYSGKTVVFELNDLSNVAPPASAMGPDENFLGPIFDDSAIRFYLIYNRRLKLFHYILDETIPINDVLVPASTTNRILIGKRTGFAYYRDHRLDRKILIGVFEGNARINNYFDGPFDQLPDNFIDGEALRSAILDVEPSLKGQIDRFGASPDGSSRFMIAPYAHYRSEEDLLPFHTCAESKKIPPHLYYGCFVVEQPSFDGAASNTAAKGTKLRKRTASMKRTFGTDKPARPR